MLVLNMLNTHVHRSRSDIQFRLDALVIMFRLPVLVCVFHMFSTVKAGNDKKGLAYSLWFYVGQL